MNILLILFLILIFHGAKYCDKNIFYEDYCSVQQGNAIKGIFALVIMLSHAKGYFLLSESDLWLDSMSVYLKQLVVVPILFYSGFGITESIRKKGLPYIKRIPVNNALKTFIWADLSVLLYALFYFVSGYSVTWNKLILSLVFWEHIENNTWYFFVIIVLYILMYLSFRVFHKNYYIAASCMTILSFIPFVILIRTREIFWYNTFFVFHCGMWYSLLRKYIEKIVMRNDLTYYACLLFVFFGYVVLRRFGSFYFFILCGCFFCISIVGLTMKVSINNEFLQFVGRHVFGFYAFQRLPMKIVGPMNMENWEKFVISVLATAFLSVAFDYVATWIDRIFFSKIRR